MGLLFSSIWASFCFLSALVYVIPSLGPDGVCRCLLHQGQNCASLYHHFHFLVRYILPPGAFHVLYLKTVGWE